MASPNPGPDSTPAIIRHLMAVPGQVPYIHTKLKQFIPAALVPPQLRNELHYLIKTNQQLYASVDGTGMLFQLNDSAGLLTFRRIDKTHHYGNNHFARYFTLNDTIYSLGGYGFWRGNGQLRYFNPASGDWSLLRLNREIQAINPVGWLDEKHGRLYCYGMHPINQTLVGGENYQHNDSLTQLYVLDIRQGNWRKAGTMIRPFDEPAEKLNINSLRLNNTYFYAFNNFPAGQYVQLAYDYIYIDDFLQNKRLRPTKDFYKKIAGFFKYDFQVTYFKDSTFYFGNITLNTFDSIPISSSDFEVTNEPVYKMVSPSEQNNYQWLRTPGLLATGMVIGFLLFTATRRFRRPATASITEPTQHNQYLQENPDNATPPKEDVFSVFDELETELIRYLISRYREGDTVSVSELNKLLGLAGKNEPIQKKNRSEKITRINEKWSSYTGKEELLIRRKRSDFDKRILEYYIDPADFEAVEALLV